MDAGAAEMLAWAQAAYFAATGVWPIVHMPSFLAVTGPKTDLWLVKTVGACVSATALAIGAAAYNGRVTPEIAPSPSPAPRRWARSMSCTSRRASSQRFTWSTPRRKRC